MKKQTFILPILVLGISVSAWAQGPRGEFGKRGPRGPMPDEVKSYIQENILPTVESQAGQVRCPFIRPGVGRNNRHQGRSSTIEGR